VVDEEGLPHSFCIEERDSAIVAGKTAGFIDDMIEHDIARQAGKSSS
jgi:hypothetical protein